MSLALRPAAIWVGRELSVTRDEALKGLGGRTGGADMKLTALLSGGFARQQGNRIGLTDAGIKLAAPEEQPE